MSAVAPAPQAPFAKPRPETTPVPLHKFCLSPDKPIEVVKGGLATLPDDFATKFQVRRVCPSVLAFGRCP